MKRFFIALAILFILPAHAMSGQHLKKVIVLDGTTSIAASGSSTSDTYMVGMSEGFFAIQVSTAGAGVLKVEYLASMDNANFQEPSGATDIITDINAGSGTVYISFSPDFCEYMKIKVTETGGASSVTPTVTLLFR